MSPAASGDPVRTEALLAVVRQLEAASRNRPVRLLLEGERGTGKQTAIEYGTSHYHSPDDLVILRGGADQFRSPFSPLAEAFAGLLEKNARNDRLLRAAADVAADLMRLVPFFSTLGGRLRDLYSAVAPEKAYPLNQVSDLIFRVQKVIRSISRHSHLLLIFSDFHQYDLSTLSVLSQLIRLNEHSCSFIFTFDPFNIPPDLARDESSLLAFQSSLLAEFGFAKIRFARFTLEQSAVAVNKHLGVGAATPSQIESLHEKAGGNPLFLRELLSHLRNEGYVSTIAGKQLLSTSYKAATLPESIRVLIDSRLARLPSELRSVMDFASVIGIEFRSDPLSEGLQLSQLLVLERLRRLERVHNLIQQMASTHRFSLEAIRDAVYENLGNAIAREHHLTLARYFTQHPEYPDVDYLLFFHYSRAGMQDQAIVHLVRSAETARAQLSHEEAAHRFRLARELRSPEHDEVFSIFLTLEEATSRYDAGQFAESARLLRELRPENIDTATFARILHSLALAEYLLDKPREADLLLARLLSQMPEDLGESLLLRALLTRSSVLYALGDWDRARETYLSCIRELPKHNEVQAADVLKRVNMFYLPELAEHFLLDAKTRLEGQEDSSLYWEVHHNIGANHLLRGNLDRAELNFNESLQHFEMIGTYRVSYPLNNLGLVALLRGDYDTAKTMFGRVNSMAVPQFDRLSARCHLALLDCLEGRPEMGVLSLERLLDEARHLSEVILWDIIGHDLAWAYRIAGRLRESLDQLIARPPIPKDLWSDFRLARRERMIAELEAMLASGRAEVTPSERGSHLATSGRSDAWRFKNLEFELNDLWFWE